MAAKKLKFPGSRKRALGKLGIIGAVLGAAYGFAYYKLVAPVLEMTPRTPGNPLPDNDSLVRDFLSHRKVVFVDAHPDDIEWWAGAAARKLADSGAQVVFIVATRGDKGLPLVGWLRERAQMSAARKLGVTVEFLEYRDKSLQSLRPRLEIDLRFRLEKLDPDLLLCWDPEYIANPHPDHVAVAQAASSVKGKWKRAYYGSYRPNLWLSYDKDIHEIKLAALAAHRTEYPPPLWQRAREAQTRSFGARGGQIGAEFAETFRMELNDKLFGISSQ